MPMRQAQEIKSDHSGQLEAQLEELRRLEEEKACHSELWRVVASCGEMWRNVANALGCCDVGVAQRLWEVLGE